MISTHILDLASGRPAPGVAVTLEVGVASGRWEQVGSGTTDADGRIGSLGDVSEVAGRVGRLRFETGPYFTRERRPVFYPFVEIAFLAEPGQAHYHVPLLLSTYGYSTYRGS